MAHLIAFLIIGAVKMVKWTLFKTRFIIASLPVAVVLIFFKDWYEANTLLADSIGLALIMGVVASWIFTLARYIKSRKHNREFIIDWAYGRYGQPIILAKMSEQPVNIKGSHY